MKHLVLSFILAATLFTACKKDDKNESVPTATGGSATVSATRYGFDGSTTGAFSSTKAGITQVTNNGVSVFSISAIRDGGNESITLTVLKKVSATGKIQFGPALSNGGAIISKDYSKPGDGALNYSTDNSASGKQGGGELNVTKLDGNEIEGTFYIVAYNNAGKEAYAEQGTFKGTIK